MAELSRPLAEDQDPAASAARALILGNPNFVLGDAEIMRALMASVEHGDRRVVDLRAVRIAWLERLLGKLREAHRDVVDAAWDSVSGVEQAQKAALALLDAQSFGRFLETLLSEMPAIFQADVARLCLEGAETRRVIVARSAVRAGRALAVIEAGGVERRLPARARGARVRLRGGARVDPALFGDDAPPLRSEALIALDLGETAGPGLLALGAVDPGRFHEEQDADPLMFLGGVVERLLREWLDGRRRGL